MTLYGFVLMMCGAAYTILVRLLIRHDGRDSLVARAIGTDFKGWISLVGYIAGIACAPFQPLVSVGLYAAVALIWLIPDPRIERIVEHS